jgi:hypothetical protein
MCFGERGRSTETIAEELVSLREGLSSLQGGSSDWRVLLDLLVSVHRLDPPSLRAHLDQTGRSAAWPQVEALRLNLRELAAEAQAMPPAERRGRLRRVGGELIQSLAV